MELKNNLGPSDCDVVFSEETADLFQAADNFLAACLKVEETQLVESEIFFDYVLGKLPDAVLGALMLQLPIADATEKLNKQLALEVAEALGPDHAQNLYRFAVLVKESFL